MKSFTIKLITAFLLFVSVTSEAAPSTDKTTSVKFNIPVLTVHPEDGGEMSRLPFTFERTNTDDPLKIILANDTPEGAGASIRGSVWLAAVTAAMFRKDPMNGVRITVEFSGDVDGPSAGGVMCLSVLSAMAGRQIPDDFAMTGTIMPDGTIGIVGGVAQKVNAAIKRGCKRICIPRYPRFETQEDGSVVDLFTLWADKNVTVKPVQNIDEVYSFLYGVRREIKVVDEFALSRIPAELEAVYATVAANAEKDILAEKEKYKEDILATLKNDPFFNIMFFVKENKYIQDFFNGRLISAANDVWYRSKLWTSLPGCFKYFNKLSEKEPLFLKNPPFSPADQKKILETLKKANNEMKVQEEQIIKNLENARGKKGYVRPSTDINEVGCWWEYAQDDFIADFRAISNGINYSDEDLDTVCEKEENRDAFIEDAKKKILYRKFFLIFLERIIKDSSFTELKKTVSLCYRNVKPSSTIPKVEKLFYSAWRALDATLMTTEEIMQNDFLYTSHVFGWNSAHAAHTLLRRRNSLKDYGCHVTATLAFNVSRLTQACALYVKYSPDCGSLDAEGNYVCTNPQFLTYLVRRARESALSSINECAREGLPCIAALQFFEEAESVGFADVSASDLIDVVLKNYWHADLTARAIMMSFKIKK